MGKSWFRLQYIIFGIVLVVGGALHILLKLFYIGADTGFYTGGGWMVTAYRLLLAAGLIGLPVMNVFHRGGNDYRVERTNGFLSVLALLAGLGILYYIWYGLPNPLGQINPNTNPRWDFYVRAANYALGSLAGLSFCIMGIMGLFLRKAPPALLIILPAAWQILLLLSRFNGYYSILHISDHLLAILFMLFATLFYMGHARTVCGVGRGDGRNYVISSGLCTAICGLFLVIPNYLYMLLNSAPIPVALLSYPESIYVLVMSVYALVFTVTFTRSIKTV